MLKLKWPKFPKSKKTKEIIRLKAEIEVLTAEIKVLRDAKRKRYNKKNRQA